MLSLRNIEIGRFRIVAIASSTGGPGLVENIIASLPADLSVPILVGQHLPAHFTPGFATRMDQRGALSVFHAESGMRVLPGSVYVGAGGNHLRVQRAGISRPVALDVSPLPANLLFKPSADEMFRSCAEVYGAAVLAIVMTGIGRDGSVGARAVRDAGGMIITQSAESCAVYGMPKSCVDAGLSDLQLDPQGIARAILRLSPDHAGAFSVPPVR